MRIAAFTLAAGLTCLASAAQAGVQGTVVHRTTPDGEFVEYVPQRSLSGILVLAHGSVQEEQSSGDVGKIAETFVRRWQRFADDHGLILLAPVFDHAYGSWIQEPGVALGGYRALEGREIGADEFVERIVEGYRAKVDGDGRFYLYGHSAGGQFAGRYAIRHPERVRALVLSAPGRYSFPDASASWPYGQKAVSVKSASGAVRVITPDAANWKKVAAMPVAIVVGAADLEPQVPRRDHPGSTRVDYARAWVDAMAPLAPQGKGPIPLSIIPGVGHNSARLTPACQHALAAFL